MRHLSPREAASLPREDLEAHVVSLLRQCRGLRALRAAHARLLRLRLPRLTAAFALSKLLASCAGTATTTATASFARNLFDQIPDPTAFCYNSLIRALSAPTSPGDPFLVYRRMLRAGSPHPNSFTLAFALKACAAVPALGEGRQLHAQAFHHGLEPSPYVQTGLLNLYAKCEEVALARTVFDGMAGDRNLVAWSAMIGGYSRVGMVNEALGLFREMQAAGVEPDEVTMVSVISACAKAGALDLGRWVHAYIDRKGITVDLELSTALIDMYAKCGLIGRAREVFDAMVERDTKAWSAMIVGLAIHGLVEDALELFSRMLALKVKPNNVTFIGVLSACAHSGLVDDGRRYWSTMQDLGIKPLMENYGCMVDLLCRSGLLDDAYSFVTGMPIAPNSIIWRTLLVASKSSNRTEIVESASKKLLELEPLNPENYVLLSNLYASSSQWERVSYMRKKMRDNNVTVVAGCSSIEINGYLHKFVVSDDSHPEIKEIRLVLREIADRVRRAGHKPWTAAVLHDVGEEEKEVALCEHSERDLVRPVTLKTMSHPFGGVAAGYNLTHLGVTGVRFAPRDNELIVDYLQRKLRGEPLLTDSVNDHDDDVYSEHPKDLVAKLRKSFEGTWYLFSPRDRKYAGGERPRRSTNDGVGFWKSMEAKKKVLGGADGKEVIGYKRGLTFHLFVDKPGDVKKKWKPTEWKMVEFVSINTDRPPKENAANPMLLNDYVLCKIMNKKSPPVTDPGLSQSQSKEEDEEEQESSDGSGASQEQQRSTSSEEQQDEQQDATPEAPNGEDAAAAAALQAAAPEDFYPGANSLDDDLGQWKDGEPVSWWTDFVNSSIFNVDDHIGTVDVAGESPEDKQPAEQQQVTSVGGAGSPDAQQQAKPEATNKAATVAAAGTASASPKTVAVSSDFDWEGWGNDISNWDQLNTDAPCDTGFGFRRSHQG
ncbi:hypothetical protein EJB05_18524, partial [Eragrostis curvula]